MSPVERSPGQHFSHQRESRSSSSSDTNSLRLDLSTSSLFSSSSSTVVYSKRPETTRQRSKSREEVSLARLRLDAGKGERYEPIPWLSSSEDELDLGAQLSDDEVRRPKTSRGLPGRKRKMSSETGKAGPLPPSPPTTPPATYLTFSSASRPHSTSPPLLRTSRSKGLASLAPPEPVTSRTASLPPPLSPPLSPPRALSAPSSPTHRRVLAISNLKPAPPSFPPGLPLPVFSIPPAPPSTAPRSPRSQSADLPDLEPLVIPMGPAATVHTPQRGRSSRSRSRSTTSPTGPTSSSPPSSRPSSPTFSILARSPSKLRVQKPLVSAQTLSSPSFPVAPGRGRSLSRRNSAEEGTSRLRRSTSTSSSISTLPPPIVAPLSPPASPKQRRPSIPLPLTPPLSPVQLSPTADGDEADDEHDERFQSLPLLRLRHALQLADALSSFKATPALRPVPSVTAYVAGGGGGAGEGSGKGAWHREQYRLYAMGRAKAVRMGGQGYWQGRGFQLE